MRLLTHRQHVFERAFLFWGQQLFAEGFRSFVVAAKKGRTTMAGSRQLILILDTTATMRPAIKMLREAYIDPLIRCVRRLHLRCIS